MSNRTPTDMDSFMPLLATTDTKMRLSVGAKLLSFVLDSSNSIICSDIGMIIDHLVAWLQSSNHKIVQLSLEILTELVNHMRHDFQPYLSTLLPHLVDKLEDSKEIIREKTSVLFLKLVDCNVITLQHLFDRISTVCFSHKNSNVREQIMYLLCTVLDTYGASTLTFSKLVPGIVKLMSDPNASVRATAFDTLCKVYKHVGERLRTDLLKKNLIPPNKLYSLMSKFDEIRASEEGINDAFQSIKIHDEDEVDQRQQQQQQQQPQQNFDTNSLKKSSSRPPITPSSVGLAYSVKSKIHSSSKTNAAANQGGVDEECFEDSFEKVPSVQVYSGRDVDECMRRYQDVFRNDNDDWSKRVDCLKKVRSLIVAGALSHDEFYDHLNLLLPPFQASIKDLRSMVVREVCITIAYLSKNLKHKFDHFAESVLSNLINLIQNSKKVIATSGLVCIRYILQYTHAPRLVPIIANNLNSKSKDIRRSCCEFVSLVLQTWPVHSIERYAPVMQEAIKKGVTDADADARLHARKAYAIFAQHFPSLAESLKNSLDLTYRKMLTSAGSNTGSSTSLSKFGIGGEVKSLPRAMCNVSLRSNSAIDLQAVKRAKTRAQYAALARQKVAAAATPNARVKTTSSGVGSLSSAATEPRVGRTKSRISISQPTSRSGSPSSRFSTYSHYLANSGGGVSRARKSSIGNDTSRETSPNRSFGSPGSGYGYKIRLSTQPVRRPVIAQKILDQSREAESQLADALGNISDLSSPYSYRSPLSRNVHRTLDDYSDESETSSMCSEHSFDSYRRPSDSMSWNGSQHRLYREAGDMPLKDIVDIIASCESTHWNERKKGLISLQYYIQDGNKLELFDLKKIMDIFLKIFNDPHIKVFSLFLDTLNELILSHSVDLCFCLHLLLTRLFNKLGTDLLNSVHSKIMKTLDNVFTSFPHDLQIQSVFRFLVDPTQTPNTRVKLAALNYIIKLTTVVDSCSAFNSSNSSAKDYATLALTKIINWAMVDNLKSTPDLRKMAQDTVLALFNLNTSQVTRRLSSMPAAYQETAATICKNAKSLTARSTGSSFHIGELTSNLSSMSLNNSIDMNLSSGSVVVAAAASATKGGASRADSLGADNNGYKSFCQSLSNNVPRNAAVVVADNGNHSSPDGVVRSFDSDPATLSSSSPNGAGGIDSGGGGGDYPSRALSGSSSSSAGDVVAAAAPAPSPPNDYGDTLKTCIDELAQLNENHQAKRDVLLRLMTLVRDSPSNAIITHFKSLLGRIISLMASSEPALIKEMVLNLLQVVVKRKTVTFLVKQFSDLVITKVISLCGDASRDVSKAAEGCAIVLSTHLPAESVVRIIVPLITSEAAPVKLVAIKMLTRLVEECGSDDSVTMTNIDQIMPVLLIAYDDIESSVRKAAVFCMVALYKQSGQMKTVLERYIAKLQGAKLKLLQLYINRAEEGASQPTSPRNS